MPETLELGHFAELGRMLKRIDRHDSGEILSIQREEAERELKRAEENLKRAEENIPQD